MSSIEESTCTVLAVGSLKTNDELDAFLTLCETSAVHREAEELEATGNFTRARKRRQERPSNEESKEASHVMRRVCQQGPWPSFYEPLKGQERKNLSRDVRKYIENEGGLEDIEYDSDLEDAFQAAEIKRCFRMAYRRQQKILPEDREDTHDKFLAQAFRRYLANKTGWDDAMYPDSEDEFFESLGLQPRRGWLGKRN